MLNKYDNLRNKFLEKSVTEIQDPPFLTFGLRFEFFDRLEPGESLEPGLLTGRARDFLKSRNDSLRVQKIDYFHQLLRKFSIDEPWWFTGISGLEKLMDVKLSGGRLPAGTSFTVSARESLDLKFLSFMESYRSLVSDKVYMREILPRNLKKFDMSVYILDQRILLKKGQNGKSLEYDDDQQGVMILKLADCEFNFNSYSSMLSTLSNEDPKTVTHSFEIKVDRVFESYNLPTGLIYGYGGTGYYSDDTRADFNFLQNIIRPKSMSMAEAGNERRVKDENYDSYLKSNSITVPERIDENGNKKFTVKETSDEEAENSRQIPLNNLVPEEFEKEKIVLSKLEISETTKEKINLNIEESSNVREILELKKLNPKSNNIRTII